MDIGQIKQKIKQNEFLKKIVFYSITSPKNPKPRCWVKWFVNPWIHKKGKGAIIRRRRSRIDVFPWNQFTVGKNSLIEDFTTINNGAGDVIIGDNARIGYEDGNVDSNEQPLVKKTVVIDEDSHIGANCVVVAGVHIGKRCQIGAGSVVTKDIPDYSVAIGNPARVIKRYDINKQKWIRI